ncbi:FAD-binding domain-containing protein [Exidia glandulosa HHB12029]|uniref:D-arabinono-1,4-lactone oxidase n=1 Tax=Exidia glandulosa HHB12029 TaxID=1314781 RepID=A0A165DCL0_EXIGL|nr:FAD-binding domain-containing protein [Exidia glandulosa HHB12029]
MRRTAVVAALATASLAFPWNTFDGPGFPACRDVSAVYHPTTVDEIVSIVKNVSATGAPIRASGVGHMWYDTMCADDSRTVIIQTNGTAGIGNFTFDKAKNEGSVVVEAGVTFFELADYLHAHNASIGFSLVNWNITLGGAISMCAHRSSLLEHSTVSGAVLGLDIVVANGTIVSLTKEEHGTTDEWYAAVCNLGLLGVTARAKLRVIGEFKIQANQKILDEDDVINGDINALIAPYPTANFWWWPGQKKFHHRFYQLVNSTQEGFQSTFSVSAFEGNTGKALLEGGSTSTFVAATAEWTFFTIWGAPNFHDKNTDLPILFWPVSGWSQDNLIGGLYPGTKPEWEYGLRGKTMELAFPMTQANKMFKRVRELLDAAAAAGSPIVSTYRSGINIKFAKTFDAFMAQSSSLGDSATAEAYKSGAIMLDWPTYLPDSGIRYNEPFYANLSATLLKEFPDARPHWTKNTREIYKSAVPNMDPKILARFKAVRQSFDPNNTFKSVLGQTLGISD